MHQSIIYSISSLLLLCAHTSLPLCVFHHFLLAKMRFSFFFFIFFVTLPLLLSSAAHIRRFLHQPFYPLDSQTPNSPSSTVSSSPPTLPGDSFFSPPPPPPVNSLPVNVSSLTLQQDSKSKRDYTKLTAAAVIAAVVSSVIAVSIAVWFYCRKRNNRELTDSKTHRSDNSSWVNCSSLGQGSIPHFQRLSHASSEFLYLGTLVDTYGGFGTNCNTNRRQNPPANSTAPNFRKPESTDLRSLPSLRQESTSGKNGNAEFDSSGGDDDEEVFYSPRTSLGSTDSSFGPGSSPRKRFSALKMPNFGSSSFSSSGSASASASPVRSLSDSISTTFSFSPKEFKHKSPELVVDQAPLFRPPPPPPPPPPSFFRVSLVERKESQSPSPSPSPPVPPPPPPPPPMPISVKNSGNQRTLTPQARRLVSEPPVSVTPTSVESPSIISQSQLPSNLNGDEKNNNKTVDFVVNSVDKEKILKPKLMPLHWDKVRACPDREMVWDQLQKSSFELNEEMIETLFVAKAPSIQTLKEATKWHVLPLPTQGNRVLDPKKSQNIAILLRALNVTMDEVCDSLLEGNADYLGTELLENLLKMAPTKEEERKLKEYRDDVSFKRGPAEKFLKAVVDIPFAFKRVEALLYISNFESEIEYLKNSFRTLESACDELRSNRMFLKLLEAVLKTGNRMNIGTNRGDAHAFKLDTLLKLVDIKGTDGKTSLLHFVVQEIIRSEGVRLYKTTESSVNDDIQIQKLGIRVVSSIGSELDSVKKAAAMDSEVLHNDVLKLSNGLGNIAEILRLVATISTDERSKFSESVTEFMVVADEKIIKLCTQESVALTFVKEITEYFHGNSSKEEAHPFRIFMVVRDFLTILDRICKEVGSKNEKTTASTAHKLPILVNPSFQQAPGGFFSRSLNSSSDDESF